MLAPLALFGVALVLNHVVVFDADARQSARDVMDAQGDIARAGCTGRVAGRP